jgi:hypothetical protein
MERKIINKIDVAAGVNHPYGDRTHLCRQPGQIGF